MSLQVTIHVLLTTEDARTRRFVFPFLEGTGAHVRTANVPESELKRSCANVQKIANQRVVAFISAANSYKNLHNTVINIETIAGEADIS